MLVAVLFFSFMGLMVKFLPDIPATQIVFIRSLVSLVISFSLLKAQKVPVMGKNRKYLLLRGIYGAVALVLFFRTLQVIPLASAVVLGYLAPIFTTILGVFIVREKVFKWQWFFFALSFAGILLVEGFDTRVPVFYLFLGIISSLFSGLAQNYIRKLNTSEHPLVIIFYFPLVTAPITGLYCLLVEWKAPTLSEWALLIMVGIITQFAQFYMTKSLQVEEISKVSSLRFLSIFNALLFGYFFFDETYNWIAYSGIALTIIGVLFNLWYKSKKQQKEKELPPSATS